MRLIKRSAVDLPAPFRPTMADVLPSLISRSRSDRAVTRVRSDSPGRPAARRARFTTSARTERYLVWLTANSFDTPSNRTAHMLDHVRHSPIEGLEQAITQGQQHQR